MPSIKDLKKRIGSVKNTQQTTKAMKMVSAAKLKRATDAILAQRPYAKEIAQLMKVVSQAAHEAEVELSAEAEKTSLLVVFSSDRGLCGGYNSQAIRASSLFIQENEKRGKKTKCIFVGKKAYEILKNRMSLDVAHYQEFGAKVTFRQASDLAAKVRHYFDAGLVGEVVFVYNKFENAITQVIQTEKVLPLEKTTQEGAAQLSSGAILFEPNADVLIDALSKKYFVVQVYKALLEGQASEHGARMGAMESATKNAGDMIRKLTLQYNKQRQAAITKELLEIISGSESQKVQ